MSDGATLSRASAELGAVAGNLSRQYPETNNGVRTTVVPINERYTGRITDPVWLAFMTAGIMVLLIACANVANLLLMRATHRSREIAIRVSLGATRRRVVRQLLVESSILATLGGVFGLAFSLLGARLLSVTLTESAPYWVHFTMDARGFVALAGVCLGSVFVFGLVPALHVSKTDINHVLQEGGRSGDGGPRARRWTATFLTAEFALTVVLLAAMALGFRNFQAAQEADVVIDPSHLLTMWVSLPAERYPTPEQRGAFFERLSERLRQIGAISSTAIASALPFGGATVRGLAIDGRSTADEVPPTVSTVTVSRQYFETIGLSVLRGRDLNERDGAAGHQTAIVNERFVAMYFPDEDPIGRRIRLINPNEPSSAAWLTIVGVCPSVRQRPQGIDPDPVVYLPLRGAPPTNAAVILRNSSDPSSLAALVRQEIRALDPELPLYRVRTMDRVVSESRLNGWVSQALVTVIACIALGLSVIGLYAVTAHAVAQRTREIGIRMALGARPRQVMRLVLQRAVRQLGLGLLAGIACTAAWERLLEDPTQRYRMTDPVVLMMIAVLVIVVAFAACLWPARRASWLEPVVALRYE
ncbi:MAG: FtsX-like permease family protein [Acidobacteria bacterium]|nr:FtsX-like permease family protein [Acidobacteriota bacterium]